MSQNDLTIANQGFASFRSDLNSALQALGSTNSGSSAPSTTFANQLFYDTTNNILKIRNEDNDAFISLFTLDQTNDNIEALTISGTLTYTGDLVSSTAGNSNFRAGVNAGNSITSGGNENVLVGDEAGTALTTGDDNVAIGYRALSTEDTGTRSVAIGHDALRVQNNDSTNYNVAVGFGVGEAVTTGTLNTLIGGLAGDAINTGAENVALGYNALSADVKGNNSVAIGSKALQVQSFSGATDVYNTAVGHNAGKSVTTGIRNTLVGSLSGDALTDADYNIALGYQTLSLDTKGSGTVAIGYKTLSTQNLTSATTTYNTAVGYLAGQLLTAGTLNTLIGAQAGDAITNNGFNTLVGQDAGGALDSAKNTCVGQQSGSLITSGSDNTILGRFNGNQNSLDIRTLSNRIILSDGDGTPRFYIDNTGKVNIGATASDGFLHIKNNFQSDIGMSMNDTSGSGGTAIRFKINGTTHGSIAYSGSGTSFNTSSDYRLKENVVDMTGAIDRVKQLLPKRFNFIIDADKTVDGFLAHEAQAVVSESVIGEKDEVDDNGDAVMQGIDQSKIVPLLTGALKEAIAKIEALETRVATLEG